MKAAVFWYSGVAFMGALAVAFPIETHSAGEAALLLIISALAALLAWKL